MSQPVDLEALPGPMSEREAFKAVASALVRSLVGAAVDSCVPYAGLRQNCRRGTIGWWCSREPGHEGPCAARRAGEER